METIFVCVETSKPTIFALISSNEGSDARFFISSILSSLSPITPPKIFKFSFSLANLTIILDDEKVFRGPGESIRIPLGAKHRAWNETDEWVEFIEVQTGTYFGEDDIVRLEDDYKRN